MSNPTSGHETSTGTSPAKVGSESAHALVLLPLVLVLEVLLAESSRLGLLGLRARVQIRLNILQIQV